MSNDIVALAETKELGSILAQSGYFQDSTEAAQAIVKILAGRELGFGPVASMTGINIIKGKVSLSANLIAASVKRSGKYNYRVVKLNNDGCTVAFFEGTENVGESTFTMQDAKAAGLSGDNWRKFPKNMCFARAISNGAKWYCPDLSGGPVYTPDELGAEIDGETGEVINVTPPQVAIQPEPAQPEQFQEIAKRSKQKAAVANGKPKPVQATKGKSDPWPAKSGPVFEFDEAVKTATLPLPENCHYTSHYHLEKVVGKFKPEWLNDPDKRDEKLSVAYDHAAAKQGEK